MGLNLSSGLSQGDLDRQRLIQNPPKFEPGFQGVSPVGFSDDFDDDDDDDFGFSSKSSTSIGSPFGSRPGSPFGSGNSSPFGSGSSSPFGGGNSSPFSIGNSSPFGGGNSSPFGGGNSSSFGGGSSFGGSSFGGSSFGGSSFGGSSFGGSNPFGGSGYGSSMNMQQQNQKSNNQNEQVFLYMKTYGSFLLDMISSLKTRTIDDWADLSYLWLVTGGSLAAFGALSTLIGWFGDLSILKLGGLGGSGLFGGALVGASGLIGLGIMTFIRAQNGEYAYTGGDTPMEVESLKQPDKFVIKDDFGFNADNEMNSGFEEDGEELEEEEDEDDVISVLDSLFGPASNEPMVFPNTPKQEEEVKEEPPKPINYDDVHNGVKSNVNLITRSLLFDTFKDFFPTCSTKFADVKELDPGDENFIRIGAKINSALETLLPTVDPSVREVQLESVKETHFAYEVTFDRIKEKKVNLSNLADELVIQLKQKKDDNISVSVEALGNKNIAIITKGESKPVTVGDCLLKDDVSDYIRNTKNRLPFISGINEIGEVQMSDLQDYLTLTITGKPRSGKSWYVNSILTTLAAFNTPEEIQFIIIDPKKTALFKTYSLLPHVCGLHDGSDVLSIFRDVIDGEAERRKKLLADHKVDNIWELREEYGIKLPVLMIVMDEIVTIYNELKQQGLNKEFTSYLQQILTQLPFIGIGLMMIPHRTTGILDPLTRMNVSYKSAVMADSDAIKEEIGKPLDRPLILPGDMAVFTSKWAKPKYLKGTGLALNDKEMRKLMLEMAKAWYKMGADIPDMTTVGSGFNRDEKAIKEELKSDEKINRIQFDTLDLDD